MPKIKNIEFLRLIAILAIVLLHIFHTGSGLSDFHFDGRLYEKLYKWTYNGQKGVDFFFILSGLFFYLGAAATTPAQIFDFTKKKVVRMWPVMFFAVLLAFALSLVGLIKFNYWGNIYALLFLNGTALHPNSANIGGAWYCSAMMFHFILFFYLWKNFNSKVFWLVLALGIYFSYATMLQAKGFHINHNHQTFNYIYNVGMMRAWGGIGIGMFIGRWYKAFEAKIISFTPTKTQKIAISVLEFICLDFMINNLMLHRFKHFNHFMFIIVFTALVVLFICRKGYISQLLERDIFPKLSKYVFSIFITHQLVIASLKNSIWKHQREFMENYPVTNMLLTLGLIIILGVLTYHLVEKPAKKILSRKYPKA